MTDPLAPEISVSRWFNAEGGLSLTDLCGKVVVMEAFQMLCPGCVSHGLPQAQSVHDLFPKDKVAVIGLHMVFEHHDAMTPVSLEAFLHEYRITFPVGVDMKGEGDLPKTMQAFQMRGTPTLILIDPQGRLRAHYFGQVTDLRLGADIAMLIGEGENGSISKDPLDKSKSGCDDEACPVT